MFEILSIILLNLIVFFPAMRLGLAADDCHHFVDVKNGFIINAYNGWKANRWQFWRIIEIVRRALYGCGIFGTGKHALPLDHLFTTVLHAAVCVLIYLAFGKSEVSYFAAILYAVNPANTQTSLWLNGRRYVVNIILVLSMILLGPWGLVLYPATLLFQVNAIFAPVLYGGWFLLATPALLIIGRKKIITFYKERMETIVNDEMRTFSPRRLIVVVKTYGFYISNLILPRTVMMMYPLLDAEGWGLTKDGNAKAYKLDKWFIIGVVALALSVAGMLALRGPMLWMGMFAFVSLFAWCNWICATQLIADRYANMSSPFVMLFVSMLAFSTPWPHVLIAFLMAWYIKGLIPLFRMYKDLESYYEYHNFNYPDNLPFRRYRANWLIKNRDVMGAWEHLRIGLTYHPNDFSFLYLAGVCMNNMANFEAAEFYFEKASQNYYIDQEDKCKAKLNEVRLRNQKMIPKIISHGRENARRQRQMSK